jgi:DNA-binding LacI/PurR family transcriptional regulator
VTRKAVTIRDVARRAGVSVATASRALNQKGLVNAQTRERILSVMDELGFAPSPAARRLSLGRTLTIGVVVSFLTRPQAAERLAASARSSPTASLTSSSTTSIRPEARPLLARSPTLNAPTGCW